MVLTRSFTRNNILLEPPQSDTTSNLNSSIINPLSESTPTSIIEETEQQTTTIQNQSFSTMNNQVFSFPPNYNVNNISLKLPCFWTSCPEAWFIQTEIQFNIKQINDDTDKYYHVVVALPQEVITKVLDILQKPPLTNKYEFLKKHLCERFSLSEEKRLEKLFSDKQIGDRKPSEFYRDMLNISGSVSMIGNELLYKLWLRKLPKELQIHLSSSNIQNMEEKLSLADKIWDVSNNKQISQINSNNISNFNDDIFQHISKICQNIENLKLEISELRTSRSRDRSNSNFRQNSRNRSRTKFDKCWYHFKFGSNAHKCIPPCNFQINNSISNNLN